MTSDVENGPSLSVHDSGVLPPQATLPQNSAANGQQKDNSNAAGDLIVKSFQAFISFIVGVSIFGASTFSIIVSEIANPADHSPNPQFARETVRTFLALSWLFFILALALGAFSMNILTFEQEKAGGNFDTKELGKWQHAGIAASFLLQALIIGAFLFLSLALVAYVKIVGWVAVGFSAAAGIFSLVLLVTQNWMTK